MRIQAIKFGVRTNKSFHVVVHNIDEVKLSVMSRMRNNSNYKSRQHLSQASQSLASEKADIKQTAAANQQQLSSIEAMKYAKYANPEYGWDRKLKNPAVKRRREISNYISDQRKQLALE